MKNKKRQKRIIGIATILVICALVLVAALSSTTPKSVNAIDTAINRAGEYLVRATNEDGSFIYEYDPIANELQGGYNILRHAGTTYAMLELYDLHGDRRLRQAAERALSYLERQIEPCGPPPGGEERCVVERGEVKLGGNGLAIVAFAQYTQSTGDEQYVPIMQQLAEWIVMHQDESGEFTLHKYRIAGGIDTGFVSAYYPGEALLALLRLYEIDADEQWLAAAQAGADWLITVRDAGKTADTIDHDHWLLYALRELYQYHPEDRYVAHARLIIDAIEQSQIGARETTNPDWIGGFYTPPRSTPAATRIEGLAAAYQLFGAAGDTAYQRRAREVISRAVPFLYKTQITKQESELLPSGKWVTGAFHASLSDFNVRIDYVQHAISALIGYRHILQEGASL